MSSSRSLTLQDDPSTDFYYLQPSAEPIDDTSSTGAEPQWLLVGQGTLEDGDDAQLVGDSFWTPTTLDDLAREQGVTAGSDPSAYAAADIWPSDAELTRFLDEIYDSRQEEDDS